MDCAAPRHYTNADLPEGGYEAPIVTKNMETVQQRLLKETDVMIAQSKKQSDAKTPATHN